ncbi:hypothetical protein GCM10010946_22410 [Undibacterium squillarum]|uniref:Uncharacterized protein n=1 Tax=Undibacterium squillarum TaxID=1131567 RepID=A0ABQ2Y000_9BURK|nr:hypothetical protein GCM10010946_22410 [Undibacterium squillarum]
MILTQILTGAGNDGEFSTAVIQRFLHFQREIHSLHDFTRVRRSIITRSAGVRWQRLPAQQQTTQKDDQPEKAQAGFRQDRADRHDYCTRR